MKKLFVIILVLVMCIGVFTACGATVEREHKSDSSLFVELESTVMWKVVYHRETKVMYAVSYGGYNGGNFTLLVNADGTPMLWED